MSHPWGTFWWWVVTAALATYFGLALVIAVGGFFDVRKMFRRLNEMHRAAGREEQGGESRPTDLSSGT